MRWSEYGIEALIHHIGPSPLQGHYRTCVNKDQQWHNADDSAVPHSVGPIDRAIQAGIYLSSC